MAKKGSGKGNKGAASAAAPARDLLAEAVKARTDNVPLMATEAEMAHLVNDPRGPLVEYNANMRQGDKIAYRATELGMNVHANPGGGAPAPQAVWGAPAPAATVPVPQASAPQASAPAGTKSYNFASDIPPPAPRRGGRGSTVYGFEVMNVGQSFFLPATGDNPNPAKRIASTVSSASNRLEPKKFIVRSVTVDENMAKAWNVPAGTKGAGIWRTE